MTVHKPFVESLFIVVTTPDIAVDLFFGFHAECPLLTQVNEPIGSYQIQHCNIASCCFQAGLCCGILDIVHVASASSDSTHIKNYMSKVNAQYP